MSIFDLKDGQKITRNKARRSHHFKIYSKRIQTNKIAKEIKIKHTVHTIWKLCNSHVIVYNFLNIITSWKRCIHLFTFTKWMLDIFGLEWFRLWIGSIISLSSFDTVQLFVFVYECNISFYFIFLLSVYCCRCHRIWFRGELIFRRFRCVYSEKSASKK